jgi:hypothetical protein
VRTTGGATLSAIADLSQGGVGRALRAANRILPASWRLARIVLAFLILRPFDLASTVWYRALGWAWIRLRARWPG